VCGSFGARQFGQLTSADAVAFHCERLDRVLLRDILRLGTATSALLSVVRVGHFVIQFQSPEGIPPGINLFMDVGRARVRQSYPALRAQSRAVRPAQRRQRERQHHRVAECRLQVELVAD
jgi:hypothetical protein